MHGSCVSTVCIVLLYYAVGRRNECIGNLSLHICPKFGVVVEERFAMSQMRLLKVGYAQKANEIVW